MKCKSTYYPTEAVRSNLTALSESVHQASLSTSLLSSLYSLFASIPVVLSMAEAEGREVRDALYCQD